MPVFSYQASDPRGKIHKGTMEARDQTMVVRKLQEKALLPIKVENKGAAKTGAGSQFSPGNIFQRISGRDIMTFTSQMATLLNAGLTLERALSVLTELTVNPKLQEVVQDILKTVQSGVPFADALNKYPNLFSKLYLNMVRAGEAGGVLELVMTRLAEFLEETQEMKEYVSSAMIYPLFLVLVGGGAVIVLLTLVLPQFTPIFEDMGIAIPWYTQILMDTSDFIANYWYLLIIAAVGGFFSFQKLLETPGGRRWWDSTVLKLPVLGDLVTKIEVARFSRTLGTLSTSGVPILNALNIVKEILGNVLLSDAVHAAYNDIKEGGGVSKPLAQSKLFPPMAIHMMAVGEETGNLEEMLLKVAERYETEVRNAVKRAISLVEPVMIVLMGLIVGFIVISMLLAVFSVNQIDF